MGLRRSFLLNQCSDGGQGLEVFPSQIFRRDRYPQFYFHKQDKLHQRHRVQTLSIEITFRSETLLEGKHVLGNDFTDG